MGQILIRNVDDHIHVRLKQKAAEQGVSLQTYVRNLLAQQTRYTRSEALDAARSIRRQSKPAHRPAEDLIREDRDSNFGNDWVEDAIGDL